MTNRTDVRVVLAIVLLAAGFFLGILVRGGGDGHQAGGASGVVEDAAPATTWTCSMHPQIRLPEPGKCPICFMDLIPLAEDEGEERSEVRLSMSPAAMKLAEIRTTKVERGYPTAELRLVGRVDVDETRKRTIAAWVAGRLDRLFVDYTGVRISEGDHLVWMYSPELVAAQEELLQALRAERELSGSRVEVLTETARETVVAAREKLRLLGLTPAQIRSVEESGKIQDHITIYAPISGTVLEKLATEGSYVSTGTPIYRIADLTHVWVRIEAYESDLEWLRYGQTVSFATEAYPGTEFEGRISFIDPVVDPRTRTARVRVNLDNPDLLLKPGMFVRAVVHPRVSAAGRVMAADLAGKWICPMHPEVIEDGPGSCEVCGMDLVTIESLGYEMAREDARPPLLVPASAPLITGKRAVVYVRVPDRDRPTFEGREVMLGPRAGDVYILREGLREGESVVVNGAFKIDSAMQIQARPSMMMPEGGVSTSGHDHGAGETAVGESAEHARAAAPVSSRVDAPRSFRDQVGEFARTYLTLSEALAADDAPAATAAAARLPARLDAIDMDALQGEAHKRWMEHLAGLRSATETLGDASTLEAMRTPFKPLTDHLVAVLRSFDVQLDVSVRRFHCPMAFDNTGADWLQSDETAANPYFGASMLRCGSELEVLEEVDG